MLAVDHEQGYDANPGYQDLVTTTSHSNDKPHDISAYGNTFTSQDSLDTDSVAYLTVKIR